MGVENVCLSSQAWCIQAVPLQTVKPGLFWQNPVKLLGENTKEEEGVEARARAVYVLESKGECSSQAGNDLVL